jgi:nonsense-mediated mRNA decay protein 3
MPHRFCAVCGKDLNDSAPNFSLCLNCYLKEHPLFELPDKFSLKICIDCNKYSIREAWTIPEEKEIFSIIEEAVNKSLLKHILKTKKIRFTFSFDKDSMIYSSKDLLKSVNLKLNGALEEDPTISHEENMKINLEYHLCKNCSNIRGGTYFLAIVQLRVKDENFFYIIQKVLDDIQRYVENLFEEDPRQYITKLVDQNNGVDLYLSTNELMNHIIKQLQTNYHFILKRSKKLVGRDAQRGKNLYRLRSLIKFLPVNKNDSILMEDKDYIVENILKDKVILRDSRGMKVSKDYSYFFNNQIIISRV